MTRLEELYAALRAEWTGQHRSKITIPLMEAIWKEELRPDPDSPEADRTDHQSYPSDSDTGHENDLS